MDSFDSAGGASTDSAGRAATAVHDRSEITPIAIETATPPSSHRNVLFLAKVWRVMVESWPPPRF
jgi:hypothetical protein